MSNPYGLTDIEVLAFRATVSLMRLNHGEIAVKLATNRHFFELVSGLRKKIEVIEPDFDKVMDTLVPDRNDWYKTKTNDTCGYRAADFK